jgi:hypothetical protein
MTPYGTTVVPLPLALQVHFSSSFSSKFTLVVQVIVTYATSNHFVVEYVTTSHF